ncbi:Hemingway/KIAA1430 [Trinorchestia longiramus]|nr:Hemingway/KIAA1430 [Trinorchestia longiramus]
MAYTTSQASTDTVSYSALSESSFDIEDSESSKDGTSVSDSGASGNSVVLAVPSMPPYSDMAEKKTQSADAIGIVSSDLEDISCGTKKKKISMSKGEGVRNERNFGSECRALKAGGELGKRVSVAAGELEGGCAKFNLATEMERVNPDICTYGRSGSPYLSSENDWEASDHSDTDADHSDSSDDDNPTSQVDRMIERGARLIMDGENSNLSSETDDTDDSDDDGEFDYDSDITDVSPLVSTSVSPFSFSPVLKRKNLPSASSVKPPFMRYYSHRGHDGDVEDEIEDEYHHNQHQYAKHEYSSNDVYGRDCASGVDADMSLVVQALLKIGLESRANGTENEKSDSLQELDNHNLPALGSSSHLDPIQSNPHHRHLRKNSHPRRKNMSFTNEEVRIINRDNSIILEKLLAVSKRSEKSPHSHAGVKQYCSKPSNSAVTRRKQEEGIKKENLAILRRIQEVKPSRSVTTSASTHPPSRHHHHHHRSGHHHHHRSHHNALSSPVRSCSATARQTAFPTTHHHSPKETAL